MGYDNIYSNMDIIAQIIKVKAQLKMGLAYPHLKIERKSRRKEGL